MTSKEETVIDVLHRMAERIKQRDEALREGVLTQEELKAQMQEVVADLRLLLSFPNEALAPEVREKVMALIVNVEADMFPKKMQS